MRFFFIILSFFFLSGIFFVIDCRKNKLKEEATSESIQIKLLSESQMEILVQIPPKHHAYLDRGDEKNYIPITFDWSSHIENGTLDEKPVLVKKPTGERNDEAGATVLRGRGNFVFESENFAKLQNKRLKVRTQICDEIKGICYRPEWKKVHIPRL